ncbi:DUF1028 domain-containing protein [Undibacterium sp. TJN25]|uniref:DUF1028 domain-containing protein n=1 Tax=Undibacterium sp. TJN25 TaxID=3413056 RepID=UPI003BF31324
MTFSIVARCPSSGALGVAVSTAVPAVGATCPYVRPGVGAVSTQSWVNPYLAIKALDLLAAGCTVREALDEVLRTDAQADMRQLGIVAENGTALSWTGKQCTGWAGECTGPDYAIQGNMLTGQETLDAMQTAFLRSVGMKFEERLLLVLEAGQANGGDKRGRQSASLIVYLDEPYPYLDLRVDEHADPVRELRRVFGVAVVQLLPFIESMPTGAGHAGVPTKEVRDMLMLPPSQRPGMPAIPPAQVDLLQTISGTDFTQDRVEANLHAFRPILAEIHKLRELDLANIHPAVIFDPTAPWRGSDK